jgi:hypothetical protein
LAGLVMEWSQYASTRLLHNCHILHFSVLLEEEGELSEASMNSAFLHLYQSYIEDLHPNCLVLCRCSCCLLTLAKSLTMFRFRRRRGDGNYLISIANGK